MFIGDNYLQLTDNNGGTITVKINKVSDQEISQFYLRVHLTLVM